MLRPSRTRTVFQFCQIVPYLWVFLGVHHIQFRQVLFGDLRLKIFQKLSYILIHFLASFFALRVLLLLHHLLLVLLHHHLLLLKLNMIYWLSILILRIGSLPVPFARTESALLLRESHSPLEPAVGRSPRKTTLWHSHELLGRHALLWATFAETLLLHHHLLHILLLHHLFLLLLVCHFVNSDLSFLQLKTSKL